MFKLPTKKQNSRQIAIDYTRDNPPPTAYSPTKGAIMASNKHADKSFRFYQNNRKIELHDRTKRDIPGPGSYRLPSDFGYANLGNQSLMP